MPSVQWRDRTSWAGDVADPEAVGQAGKHTPLASVAFNKRSVSFCPCLSSDLCCFQKRVWRASSVSESVFLPVHVIARWGIHALCALLVWVNSTRSRHSRVLAASMVRLWLFAGCDPAGHSLRRVSRLAFPAPRVPLLPRHGDDSYREVRKMDLSVGFETGSALSQPSPGRSSAALGSGARAAVLPPGERDLHLP